MATAIVRSPLALLQLAGGQMLGWESNGTGRGCVCVTRLELVRRRSAATVGHREGRERHRRRQHIHHVSGSVS